MRNDLRLSLSLFFLLFAGSLLAQIKTSELRVRDPYIIVADGKYYLISSGRNAGSRCLQAYESTDLENWERKGPVSEVPKGYLGTNDWWAPDTYYYKGNYYVFVTLSNEKEGILRGTTVMKSDGGVLGPYRPIRTGKEINFTPADYQCLDGSLYIDAKGRPWMIYCVEWIGPNVENQVGEIWAIRLRKDLKGTKGKGRRLFKASEAKWPSHSIGYMVTDAPTIVSDPVTGHLIMTWSSFVDGSPKERYAIGQAVSENGLFGPWRHLDEPIFNEDGGHSMIFRDLEGNLRMSFHCPNSGRETLTIKRVEISNDKVRIID